MIAMTLAEIADVVGGEVVGDPTVTVTGAAFRDDREPIDGGLFVAIAGERVDGHDFAARAVAGGAVAVLGTRPTDAPTVVVPDVVVALGALARHVVDRVRPTVLALTGSQGKTGTKDYLGQVLAAVGSTVATAGNLNNELGVPLTVLRCTAETEYLVVEMGARGIGHIAELCRIAPPDVAAVLNVGTAHLGEFGSREAIARAKGELVEALGPEGTAVLNADDDLVMAMGERTSGHVLTFGERADVSWRDVVLDDLGRPSFALGHGGDWHDVSLTQSGVHQVANAAAAAAMAIAVGVDLARVAGALTACGAHVALADGAARARRRAGRRQRRLQRQPRVDGRRDRRAGRDRRSPRRAAPSPCWARCSSSARSSRGGAPAASGGTPPSAASTWSSPSAPPPRASGAARPAYRTGRASRSPRRAATRHWPGCARMLRLAMCSS